MTTPPPAPVAAPPPERLARLREQEFAALRATIRERGSLRITLVVATMATWGGLTVATSALVGTPVATLIPLLVLAAGFEAIFALHVGVERIGRYLQVEYEGLEGGPAWEHAAMRFGATQGPPAGRVDPLFSAAFAFAAVLNLVPVVLMTVGVPGGLIELAAFGLIHAAFIARVLSARSFARTQRALDLALLSPPRD